MSRSDLERAAKVADAKVADAAFGVAAAELEKVKADDPSLSKPESVATLEKWRKARVAVSDALAELRADGDEPVAE